MTGNANIMLIKALQNVILPIVQAYLPGLDVESKGTHNSPHPVLDNYMGREIGGISLEPETEQLVAALDAFIRKLIQPQKAQSEKNSKALDRIQRDPSTSSADSSQLQVSKKPRTYVNEPHLLKLALAEVRYRVFNKMPIRLLAFNSDGSNIELIERSTIMNLISTAIKADFDEDKIQSEFRIASESSNSQHNDAITEAQFIQRFVTKYTDYAILSHTWLHDSPGEITYASWICGDFDNRSPGYSKLASFCRVAAVKHCARFGWMDTVCINKDSSAELDESIRSMYAWYKDAYICITYLAQTMTLKGMRDDPWFTRGWTLQELLAPEEVIFYNAEWKVLGAALTDDDTRVTGISKEIESATSITPFDFRLFRREQTFVPISQRMKWAADRKVTREEDVAYSLMGIFGVSISIAYGEGAARSFVRLIKEIIGLPGAHIQDFMNWGYGPSFRKGEGGGSRVSSLIPLSPKQYTWRADRHLRWSPSIIPLALTHLGLHISVLLLPITPNNGQSWESLGSFHATVKEVEHAQIDRPAKSYCVLDRMATAFHLHHPSSEHLALGLLNFEEEEDRIVLHQLDNIAILCSFAGPFYGGATVKELEKIPTWKSIDFDFEGFPSITEINEASQGSIQKKKLAEHGMRLVTVYL
ncbi:hypothetical protein BDN70DRAFT_996997 [Pholiota conissans]|uniref:Heterokaryon incompatibility domain-containing protein n=1 Tax=Pholiota conissans TaxID=109636 RepID=A0A9P6CQ03_9AGAR|nr:hypothetical protein BDN70DRAFT_996997 [Pholiota conissans]